MLALVPIAIVMLGVAGAGCCTGYSLVQSDDLALSAYVYAPPWDVGDWMSGAPIELAAAGLAVATLWGALILSGSPKARERRWSPTTRRFVWAFVVLSVCFALFATVVHTGNWLEWHALLAEDPSIPHDPQPGQIPAGVAAFLAVPAGLTGIALLLRARGRM